MLRRRCWSGVGAPCRRATFVLGCLLLTAMVGAACGGYAGPPDIETARDGLPPDVERSLAAHRGRLDETFCRATAGIDLDRDSRRALAIALY